MSDKETMEERFRATVAKMLGKLKKVVRDILETKETRLRASANNMLEKLDKVTAGRKIKSTSLEDRLLFIAAEEVDHCLKDYKK